MRLGWRFRDDQAPLSSFARRATVRTAETVNALSSMIPASSESSGSPAPVLRRQQSREIRPEQPGQEHLKKAHAADRMKKAEPLDRVRVM